MLKVLKSGFYTTLQDSGRFGFREYGGPISGAMDSYSNRFANTLLGNCPDAAVLEITMTGPQLQFLKPTYIAISGAEMYAALNDKAIKRNSVVSVNKSDILSFGRTELGFRTYLAVKDGFKSKPIMGSLSQFAPLTEAHTMVKGDFLHYNIHNNISNEFKASVKYNNSILIDDTLTVLKGPEFNKLSDSLKSLLLNMSFMVSKHNNRMAYQLEPILKNDLEPILTAPVLPGTIQLTPSGSLIILMRDCQTTGGYPRVLQLTHEAIDILSQKTTGTTLKIRLKD